MKKKIRIKLESFNYQQLLSSCIKIVNFSQTLSKNPVKIVSLPTCKRIYCVLRSPHVDKDSREHFEIRVHKRILDIYPDSELSILSSFSELHLSPGVSSRVWFID